MWVKERVGWRGGQGSPLLQALLSLSGGRGCESCRGDISKITLWSSCNTSGDKGHCSISKGSEVSFFTLFSLSSLLNHSNALTFLRYPKSTGGRKLALALDWFLIVIIMIYMLVTCACTCMYRAMAHIRIPMSSLTCTCVIWSYTFHSYRCTQITIHGWQAINFFLHCILRIALHGK